MELTVSLKGSCHAAYPILKGLMPLEKMGRMERGIAALDRDSALLNSRGEDLVHKAHWLFTHTGQLPMSDFQNMAHELTDQLPLFERPHLELYRKPDVSPLLYAMGKGIKSFVFEISNGCENQCLFCVGLTQAKMFFMPSPMFMLLADSIRGMRGRIAFITARTDPMLYRDVLYGTDFADLFLSIRDIYAGGHCEVTDIRTGAWPKGHRFALAAAHKMNNAGQRVDLLSLSLLHKDLNLPDPPRELLDEYAARYATAISLLRPRKISLRGLDEDYRKMRKAPLHFEKDYLEDFYEKRILPAVSPELRAIYGKPITPLRRYAYNEYNYRVPEDGEVVSDYISTFFVTFYNRARLPICKCNIAPDIVMVIYPDGSYSLQEKGNFPRETGNLF